MEVTGGCGQRGCQSSYEQMRRMQKSFLRKMNLVDCMMSSLPESRVKQLVGSFELSM